MRIKDFFLRNRFNLIFLCLLVAMFFIYRYNHSIVKAPYSIHSWRQSSGTSIALNYEREDIGFFEPAIHWTGDGEYGRTIVEFPLIYYTVGKIWKLVGHHEFIFRLLNLLIVFTGLFFLYRLLYEFLGSPFWSMIIPLLVFTSPTLVYYANNTLMNAPAFGLVLIGAYFYWRYIKSEAVSYLYISMLLFMLAGLLKLPALILFTAILIIHVLSNFRFAQSWLVVKKPFKASHLIPFLFVIAANTAWYLWAGAYSRRNIQGVFLHKLNPIWKTTLNDGLYIGTRFYTELLDSLFNITAMFICLLLLLWLVSRYRKANPFLLGVTVLVLGGILLYILFFYNAMAVHDYYLLNIVIIIPLVLLSFLDFLRVHHPGFFSDRKLKNITVFIFILLMYGTMVEQRAKYDLRDTFTRHTIILNTEKKDRYEFYQERYKNNLQALETIQPYLRELGIRRENKVLSIPDETPCHTLYLMDQKGVTDYGYSQFSKGGAAYRHHFDHGVKYIIVNDPALLKRKDLQPFFQDKIGQYRNVNIFNVSIPDKQVLTDGPFH